MPLALLTTEHCLAQDLSPQQLFFLDTCFFSIGQDLQSFFICMFMPLGHFAPLAARLCTGNPDTAMASESMIAKRSFIAPIIARKR